MFKPPFGFSVRIRGKRQQEVRSLDDNGTGLYLLFEPQAQNGFVSSAFCMETMVSKEEFDSVQPGDTFQLVKA